MHSPHITSPPFTSTQHTHDRLSPDYHNRQLSTLFRCSQDVGVIVNCGRLFLAYPPLDGISSGDRASLYAEHMVLVMCICPARSIPPVFPVCVHTEPTRPVGYLSAGDDITGPLLHKLSALNSIEHPNTNGKQWANNKIPVVCI